jgi:hypothetical protein
MPKATIDDAQISETAYLIWLDEGQPAGRDEEHWLAAIDALNAPKAKAKPARKAAAKPRAAKASAKTATKAAPKKAAKPKAKAAKK